MVDIAKCNNVVCPKNESCYRYIAPASEYQTYGKFEYDAEGNCEYYWQVGSTDDVVSLTVQIGD